MTALPSIDTQFLTEFLARLLNTPSPTGFTARAFADPRARVSAVVFP